MERNVLIKYAILEGYILQLKFGRDKYEILLVSKNTHAITPSIKSIFIYICTI